MHLMLSFTSSNHRVNIFCLISYKVQKHKSILFQKSFFKSGLNVARFFNSNSNMTKALSKLCLLAEVA